MRGSFFAFSDFVARSITGEYNIQPDKVIVVGGGGNLELLSETHGDYHSETALMVGYDFERKGGHVLLKAWEQVAKACPNAKLLIAGPQKPDLDTPRSVRWLGAVNNPSDLIPLFEKASLFVMPSLFEPWGHVFMEAMSFGLPLIGTTMCAMPEFIRHGENGLLVPPADADALAAALIDLLSNPDKAQQLGQQAHEDYVKHHTWDSVILRMQPHFYRVANA